MKNIDLVKRVKPYFKRYRGILFIDLFCAALTTVSEMALPLILRFLTNTGMKGANNITISLIFKLSFLFVILRAIDLVASYYMASIGHIMGAKIERDMREDVYLHLQKMSDSFYNETKIGVLMSRITNDLNDITEFAHHCPEEYFIGAIKILFSFFVLFSFNKTMTILIFLMLPFMIFFASKFRSKMRNSQKAQRVHIGNLNSSIEDSLLGIKVVKSFANEDVEAEKFKVKNNKFLDIKKSFYYAMAGFTVVTKLFDGLMYLILIITGGYFMMVGEISAGDLVAYIMFVTSLLATVKRLVEFTEQFQKGMTGIERYAEIMDSKSDIVDKENALELKDAKGKIELKNVYFKYEKDLDYVLEDFTLEIEPGRNIAIVGPSGAGKSTICNLIPRFYDVNSGEVLVDGFDVRDLKIKSLRDNIGIMQQDVYLFSGSVLDNIRYGKVDATKEEIIKASKLAGAYNFIKELPEGFETYIGERGVKLSGGQKQRLSIARVFLKNPPILILDEATSALDNKSEELVQKSIEVLSKGRTTVTIAHRLTTIQNADEIILINDKKILERGSHIELMNKRGFYYDLYTKGGLIDIE